MFKENLENLLDMYQPSDEDEKGFKLQMMDFLSRHKVVFGTENLEGHFTGSAWILNEDRTKALMTHHAKLNKWLQLGGHTELDETINEAALREAKEESGLSTLTFVSPMIFDIDCHKIPERKGLPEHWHLDVRFLIEAKDADMIVVSEESHDVKWLTLEEIESLTEQRSVTRMIEKTRAL